MPKYTVVRNPGADNEKQTNHATWQAAFNAVQKHYDERGHDVDTVEVLERSRDGLRCYNSNGDLMWYEAPGERESEVPV